MKQFSLPKNIVATVQLWSTVLLLVLALVFSLLPMVTIKTADHQTDIRAASDKLFSNEGVVSHVPGKITLSALDLFDSMQLFAKIYKLEVGIETAVTDEEIENVNRQAKELSELIDTKDGEEDFVNTLCLYVIITDALELHGSEELITMLLRFVVALISVIFVIILTAVLPFILLILLIVSLIKALRNIRTPEEAAPIVASKLIGCIPFILSFMLIQRVIPGMTFGSGTILLFLVCIASALVNFAASRLRIYPDNQFKYLNVLQLTSLVGSSSKTDRIVARISSPNWFRTTDSISSSSVSQGSTST